MQKVLIILETCSLNKSNDLSTVKNIYDRFGYRTIMNETLTGILCENIIKILSIKKLLTNRINKIVYVNNIWTNMESIYVFFKLSLNKKITIYIKSHIIYLLCIANS